jgi:hypothetical protein
MDPGLVGPELLAGFAGRTSVGAFLPLCPSTMSGSDPRASKSRYTIIDTTGSHQNNKHLLGPSPGSEAPVGGYISVPARTQISWDLIPTDIDGDLRRVGPGLVDPAADDRVIPRMFQDVHVHCNQPCLADCLFCEVSWTFRVVVQLALSG